MRRTGSQCAILAAFFSFGISSYASFSVAEPATCGPRQPVPSALSDIPKIGKETLNAGGGTAALISSEKALRSALLQADPPTRIALCSGSYGRLKLDGITFENPTTIFSVDPNHPAYFSEVRLKKVTNLTFEDINFTSSNADRSFSRPFQVLNSTNIGFNRLNFLGADRRGFPKGQALFVQHSRQIEIRSSEFRHWHRGVVFSQSSAIIVANNRITGMTSDGLNFNAVDSVEITGNYIGDFVRDLSSKDHADMIQFWTRGTSRPNIDILIQNNILDSGAGWFTQSIFMRNEVLDRDPEAPNMAYRDVRIIGNHIRNAHLHGITVGQAVGVVVRDNKLERHARSAAPDMGLGHSTPGIRVHPASRNVWIFRNQVSKVTGYRSQSDWTVTDNKPVRTGYADD